MTSIDPSQQNLEKYFTQIHPQEKGKNSWFQNRLVVVKNNVGQESLIYKHLNIFERVGALFGGRASLVTIVQFCNARNIQNKELFDAVTSYKKNHPNKSISYTYLIGEENATQQTSDKPQELEAKSTVGAKKASDTNTVQPTPNVFAVEVSFQQLAQNSQDFLKGIGLKKSPTTNNSLENIAPTKELQQKVLQFAKETRPLFDPKVLLLISDFLTFKCNHGTQAEKKLYTSMTEAQFIERLFSKRPLMFMNYNDACLLRDGTYIANTAETSMDFTEVKNDENRLKEYISYDEMQIGALLSIAGPSLFVNDGDKMNKGTYGEENSFEKEAIICGAVGCRFERKGLMEYQHMLITEKQNTSANGYGAHNSIGSQFAPWSNFYGVDHFPTYTEMQEALKTPEGQKRYIDVGNGKYLDVDIYKKRLRLSLAPFIQDMNTRAVEAGKQAYVRLTGLGLGVWAISRAKQSALMLEVVQEILMEGEFKGISDIDFAWVNGTNAKWKDKSGKVISMRCTQNSTSSKLTDGHEGKLLGSNYAWDGASFPGNEYWIGALTASMDPATACTCQIKDLHNIYINPYLKQNIVKKLE